MSRFWRKHKRIAYMFGASRQFVNFHRKTLYFAIRLEHAVFHRCRQSVQCWVGLIKTMERHAPVLVSSICIPMSNGNSISHIKSSIKTFHTSWREVQLSSFFSCAGTSNGVGLSSGSTSNNVLCIDGIRELGWVVGKKVPEMTL